ncbi:hypothetical protein ACFL5Q_07930 [Planctomycetota bacterium]
MGVDAGAIDVLEDEGGNWLVLEAETDSFVYHLCRAFRFASEFGEGFDFDDRVAEYVSKRKQDGLQTRMPVGMRSAVDGLIRMLQGRYSAPLQAADKQARE